MGLAGVTWKAVGALILLLCLSSLALGELPPVNISACQGKGSGGDLLYRKTLIAKVAQSRGAYCNDYSIPHYYLSNAADNNHGKVPWIIFLEGGGLCDSERNCTERYLHPSSHMLMTSAPFLKFINGSPANVDWPSNVTGHALLSGQITPFNTARRLLLPYCSSDLWQGNDSASVNDAHKEYLWFQQNRHEVLSLSKQLSDDELVENLSQSLNRSDKQFTFRGRRIFEAIMEEMLQNQSLCNASSILLAGSSAGGVGAFALAPWLKAYLRQACAKPVPVAILGDSNWFINYDNALGNVESSIPWLHGLDEHPDSEYNFCNPSLASGYRCCMSTHCVLQLPALRDMPKFTTFSSFDGYIPSLYFNSLNYSNEDTSNTKCIDKSSQSNVSLAQVSNFLRFVLEYGGAMNFTIDVGVGHGNLGYFVPSCLQHVYLSTSSLWDLKCEILGSEMADWTYEVRRISFK